MGAIRVIVPPPETTMTLFNPRITVAAAVLTDPLQADAKRVSEVKIELVTRAAQENGGVPRPVMVEALSLGETIGALTIFENPDAYGVSRTDRRAWLWIAAANGDREAGRRLKALLADADAGDAQLDVPALENEVAEVLATIESGGHPLEEEFGRFADAEADAGFEPGKVVISAIGDPESKDGKDLARRFGAVVGKCLPFSGGIPQRGEISAAILGRWPWLKSVARQVEDELAVLRLSNAECVRLRPLLFVGPPGCGKTSVARFILDSLGLFKTVVACGGTSDSGGVGAVTRGWATARPGAAAAAALEFMVANPGFVFDEIDKSPDVESRNGSAQGVLLSMTEGEPFRDSCLLGTVDTSAMTFIATANKINRIDEGLLERFLVIRFEEPDAEHLDALFTNCRADYSRERGLDIANLVEFNAAKFEVLKRFLKRERSARVFRKVFDILANDLIRDFEATRVLH
jgi:hypothetical protein